MKLSKRFFVKILAGILSGGLLIAGLWQLEMIWVHKSWGFTLFVMPFGWQVPYWFARDIWYTFIFASFLLAIYAVTNLERETET